MAIEYKGEPITEDQLMAALSMPPQDNLRIQLPETLVEHKRRRQQQSGTKHDELFRHRKAESLVPDDPLSESIYQDKVYISPDRKVSGIELLRKGEVNLPNAAGMTPFQVALAVRDLDALAKIVQNEEFKLCQSSNTNHRPLFLLGTTPTSGIASSLVSFLKATENFHPPKPMDEIEESMLRKFVQTIDSLGISENKKKSCEEVLDTFKTNLSGCALADMESKRRGDCGLTISVFDPASGQMVDSDAMELIDELYFKEGHQTPKEDRWVLRAIHMTNLEIDMPEDLRTEEQRALAQLKDLTNSSEFISKEYIFRLMGKLSAQDVEQGLALVKTLGERAKQKKLPEKTSDKEAKSESKADPEQVKNKTDNKKAKPTDDTRQAKQSLRSEKTKSKNDVDHAKEAIRVIKEKSTIAAGPFAGLGSFSLPIESDTKSDSKNKKQSSGRTDYGGVSLRDHAKRVGSKLSKSEKTKSSISADCLDDEGDQHNEENDYNL